MEYLKVISTGDGADLDLDGPRTTTSLRARRLPLASPAEQLSILNQSVERLEARSFDETLRAPLTPSVLEILQINLGKLCNMTCRHCHVDAGPDRFDEVMDRDTVDACLQALERCGVRTVDLTGGAPELNPHFEYLVDACVTLGVHVIDRCNLTILTTNRYRHLPEWFAERGVEVVCSLPHYRQLGTDAQRGEGAFERSLQALRMLNAAGYGQGDPAMRLVLVTNPVGAFLAGNQTSLESEWKAVLLARHGISFDSLYALNNMPISRFLEWLIEKDMMDAYLERLVNAYNPATVEGLMCRNTVSVSWDGRVFDCDFNQMLEIEADLDGVRHIRDFDLALWQSHQIRTAPHCYGCTAGSGSSCGGALQ